MSFSDRLLQWYAINGRPLPWRITNNSYIVWISEIVLQQTRVDQGIGYVYRFVEAFPNVEALAAAPTDQVLRIWQGLGYYSRARNLHVAAKQIVSQRNGQLPQCYNQWLQVKGVGPYTAAAIASIAFNQPVAAVDGNVFRVISRIFALNENIDTSKGKKVFYQIASELIDSRNPGNFNQAMMDFGATVCKPASPKCNICVFNQECLAFLRKSTNQFPQRKKRVKPRQRHLNYFLFYWKEERGELFFLVNQRKGNDIWKNLYELPLIETQKHTEVEGITKTETWKLWFPNSDEAYLATLPTCIKHQLTHQIIVARFFMLGLNPARAGSLMGFYQKVSLDAFEKMPKSKLMCQFIENQKILNIFNE